ncbi:MAG: thioredoxin family protein [Flavobacteriales bacterium]|nr:thioredoxin family protein [Flavobacteriales bacterium]
MARTPTTAIPLGFTAPDFQLPDTVSGHTMGRDELMAGDPTVVVFMCNHCPFVVHILPEFVAFAAEYMTKGVNVIAISSNDVTGYPMDGPEHMTALATESGFTFPYLYDESQSVAREYEAACTPDFSVFNADMRCVYRGQFDGARPGNDVPVTGEDLRRVLDTLLAGGSVPEEDQIPSLGCNIKWKA